MNWLIGIAILILIGYLLDREIYFYEGVHLGPRVQAWLYDRWSRKYDVGKRESQLRDDEMLARPLLELTKDIPEPFIMDFATGTGRLSYALVSQRGFNGNIVALDLSQGMLEQAAEKLSRVERASSAGQKNAVPPLSAVTFLRHQTLPLPFPEAAFDAVCALEVLELFPNMDEPLAEFARVLRPGGILLTSRGTEESGRRAKVKSRAVFTSLLERHGFAAVEITPWWKLFDRVFAKRAGTSAPVGEKKLSAVLRCGRCGQVEWREEAGAMSCQQCGHKLSVTRAGIVLN
jgi:ubiquinone/menaquinone biosynthesis C-methylase UbiE/DNA-directed RNA polymerase subunit RPC12/RpoP